MLETTISIFVGTFVSFVFGFLSTKRQSKKMDKDFGKKKSKNNVLHDAACFLVNKSQG